MSSIDQARSFLKGSPVAVGISLAANDSFNPESANSDALTWEEVFECGLQPAPTEFCVIPFPRIR